MSLSKPELWILRDKHGNPPPPNIENFIRKLRKGNLLPCPRTADDLQMPDKGDAPREMNSFIVFRRQLAHVAKMGKTSDDGRVISAAASYIWNGASQQEKNSYTLIADELKRRHRIKYPNYTYERRKRKTESEDFIVYTGAMEQNKNKKRQKKSQPAPKVIPVPEQQQEPECVPITTISSSEVIEGLFNPLTSQAPQFSQVDNNNYYGPTTYYDDECLVASVRDENIPIVYQIVTNSNYTNSNPQLHSQNLLYYQQPQELIQQLSPTYDEYDIFNGITDMGINQTSYLELERPISEVIYSNYLE